MIEKNNKSGCTEWRTAKREMWVILTVLDYEMKFLQTQQRVAKKKKNKMGEQRSLYFANIGSRTSQLRCFPKRYVSWTCVKCSQLDPLPISLHTTGSPDGHGFLTAGEMKSSQRASNEPIVNNWGCIQGNKYCVMIWMFVSRPNSYVET